MSSIKALFIGTLLPLSFALAQNPGVAGSLQGSVTDAQGRPLPGAVVRYQSVPSTVAAGVRSAFAPGANVVNGSATADANGRFAVAGLPAAAHLLCASVPSAPYLDPCIWEQAMRVAVPSSLIVNQNLVLAKGVYLNVRVNDPNGLLPQVVDGPWTPRELLVGVVYGTGAYQGARNTSVDPAGRNYQLIVPSGKAFYLRLYSTEVVLSDASGAAVAAPSGGVAFQASSGQDQTFTFTVRGHASRVQ